jgi:hypothetical protein
MAQFFFLGESIDLPAIRATAQAGTRDETAWRLGVYITVQLIGSMSALRVHTQGRSFPERPASNEAGAWLLIGDVIETSSGLASSRSLPGGNPLSMVAFTHTSEALLAAATVLNIGVASAKWQGMGGGFQAEYVRGPAIRFVPLAGNVWHGRSGQA